MCLGEPLLAGRIWADWGDRRTSACCTENRGDGAVFLRSLSQGRGSLFNHSHRLRPGGSLVCSKADRAYSGINGTVFAFVPMHYEYLSRHVHTHGYTSHTLTTLYQPGYKYISVAFTQVSRGCSSLAHTKSRQLLLEQHTCSTSTPLVRGKEK